MRQGGVGTDDLRRAVEQVEVQQREEAPGIIHHLRFVFAGAAKLIALTARGLSERRPGHEFVYAGSGPLEGRKDSQNLDKVFPPLEVLVPRRRIRAAPALGSVVKLRLTRAGPGQGRIEQDQRRIEFAEREQRHDRGEASERCRRSACFHGYDRWSRE